MLSRSMPSKVALPLGLEAALESLAREILRSQPPDELICRFAADHFEALIRKRDENAHSSGLSPSPSAAAAATATKKDSVGTPPGSNGHADGGSSPPPRPPPKKSHAEKNADPTPPALPPKRASKTSSGSQGKESTVDGATNVDERNGVGGGGATTPPAKVADETDASPKTGGDSAQDATAKTDASSSGRGSVGVTPDPVSPPEAQKKSSDTPVSEAAPSTEAPSITMTTEDAAKEGKGTPASESMEGENANRTDSGAAIKKGEEMIEMSPLEKISMTPTESDGDRPKSTPVEIDSSEEVSLPSSAVIASSGEPETKTSPREEEIKQEEVKGEDSQRNAKSEKESASDVSKERPESQTEEDRTPSSARLSSISCEKETISGDRPNSQKEIESVSAVSDGVAMDSAVVVAVTKPEDERRRSAEGEISPVISPSKEDGGEEVKGTQAPPIAGATSSADEAGDIQNAAIDVPQEVNKREAQTDEVRSPASESAGGKTSPAVSLDECGNIVLKERVVSATEIEDVVKAEEDKESETNEKSFGFGDSASLDTVVHVKTEGSTELPGSSSQEKIETVSQERPVSFQEEVLEPVKEEMPVSAPKKEEERPMSSASEGEVKTQPAEAPKSEEKTTPSENDKKTVPSPTEKTETAEKPVSQPVQIEEKLSPAPVEQPKSNEKSPSSTAQMDEKSVSSPETLPEPEEKPAATPEKSEDKSLSPTKENTATEEKPNTPPAQINDKSDATAAVIDGKADLPSAEISTSEEKPVSPGGESEVNTSTPTTGSSKPEEKPISPPQEIEEKPAQKPENETNVPKERPISATEEQVASVLLAEAATPEPIVTKEKESAPSAANPEEIKDIAPSPEPDSVSGQDPEFPAPPDLNEDGEIQSPNEEENFRARSASFELVETLKLRGSLDEEDGEEKVYKEGRGLVNRPPTPVNTDWPPSQEEEDEERESISPEATATPSVTSESKQSLEDEVAAKLPKDSSSPSLSGSNGANEKTGDATNVAQILSPRKLEEKEAKENSPAVSPVKSSQEESKSDQSPKEVPAPSAPSSEEIKPTIEEEKAEVVHSTKEENQASPEEIKCIESKESASMVQSEPTSQELNVDTERAHSASDEERMEAEEAGRKEVEEVCKLAVEEAERRDRESRMEGSVDDTIVVESAVTAEEGGETKESVESAEEINEESNIEEGKSNGGCEKAEIAEEEKADDEKAVEAVENGQGTKEIGKKESPTPERKEDEVEVEKGVEATTNGDDGDAKDVLEVAVDAVDKTIESAMDIAATKIQATFRGYKSRLDTGAKGEAEKEKAKIPVETQKKEEEEKSEDDALPPPPPEVTDVPEGEGVEPVEGGEVANAEKHPPGAEDAAAVKIQSTFRGYRVRREAEKGGKKGEAEEGGEAVAKEGAEEEGRAETEPSQPHSPSAARSEWQGVESELQGPKGLAEVREGGGRNLLRREDAVVGTSPSGSAEGAAEAGRASGEFHDHVVLPPLLTAAGEEIAETGRMREEAGAAPEAGDGDVGDGGAGGHRGGAAARGLMDSAAARIQAGYRGYRVRKRLREVQNNGTRTESSQSENAAPAAEEKEGKAATKIQAGVRGFLTRRRLKRRREEDCENNGGLKENGKRSGVGGKEAEAAAVKIQAGFRGYKGRQKAKARRQQDGKNEVK